MNKSAQTWSFDLIVAVILFIVIVAVFYSFLSSDSNRDVTVDLQVGAESIAASLNCDISPDSDVCIIDEGTIDQDELDALNLLTYDQLKNQLGVTGDFCVYLRDKDSGALVPFDNGPNEQAGIGDGDSFELLEVGGAPIHCGDNLP